MASPPRRSHPGRLSQVSLRPFREFVLMRAFFILFVLAAAVSAQTVTLPFPAPLVSNTQLPFAAGVGRYQEWFSLAQAQNFGTEPSRLQSLTILAGTSATISTTLDCEISMCHAPVFGLNSTFDSNLVGPRVIVRPRTTLTLLTAAAGQPVLTVPFTELFTWDGQRPFLVDVRIFGNGRSNAPFNADQRSTDSGFNSISRVYAGGNASATSGQLTAAQGFRFVRVPRRTSAMAAAGSTSSPRRRTRCSWRRPATSGRINCRMRRRRRWLVSRSARVARCGTRRARRSRCRLI